MNQVLTNVKNHYSRSRPLSMSERVYMAMDRLYSPFVNQFVLEGIGTFDVNAWQQALTLAADANPGCRLVLRGRLGWSRFVDSGIAPRLRVIESSTWSGLDPQDAEFLKSPLSLTKGQSCEVVLLTGEPARAIFRSHHAVMDGGGTLWWAQETFRALNGMTLRGSVIGVTDSQLAKTFTADAPIKWNRIYPAPTGCAKGDDTSITWQRIKVVGKHSMMLAKIALFIAGIARSHGGEIIHFAIPADMRKQVSTPANTGNLTGFIHIMVDANATPESITQQIRDKLAQCEFAAQAPGATIAPFIPVSVLSAGIKKTEKNMRLDSLYGGSAVLSNLGRLNFEAFTSSGFCAHRGFFIPPGTGVSPMFMALSGNEEGSDLVVAMPQTLANSGRLNNIMTQLQQAFTV